MPYMLFPIHERGLMLNGCVFDVKLVFVFASQSKTLRLTNGTLDVDVSQRLADLMERLMFV